MSYDNTKNDVKQLVEKIELVAKELQNKLTNGGDYLTLASELVRHNSTFTFALGEMCALELLGTGKKTRAKVVRAANPNATPKSFHRDSRGRFAKI
jgi:hypothetical protein